MTALRTTVASLAFAAMAVSAPSAWAQAAPSAFDPNDNAQTAYVDGNLYFLAYHEVGHLILDTALVDQEKERENAELAADDVAIMVMIPDPGEDDQDEAILAAMVGWARSAGRSEGVAASPHYPDDAERASRIACYLFGSNPALYQPLRKIFSVTLASADCEAEFAALTEDMSAWFGEALVEDDGKAGVAPTVRYAPAPPALRAAQAYLKKSEVLENIAADIGQFVSLSEDTSIIAQSCGGGAAEFRYDPGERAIIACYEAVDWLMRDANDEEQAVVAGGGESASEGVLGSGGARVTQRPRTPRRPRP